MKPKRTKACLAQLCIDFIQSINIRFVFFIQLNFKETKQSITYTHCIRMSLSAFGCLCIKTLDNGLTENYEKIFNSTNFLFQTHILIQYLDSNILGTCEE